MRQSRRHTQPFTGFVPALRETKGGHRHMASIASFVSTANSMAYSTSKAPIRTLTQISHRSLPGTACAST
jgi:hypothetical protein